MPTVVTTLRQRPAAQDEERAVAPRWVEHTHDGEPISLVSSHRPVALVLRQTVPKLVKQGVTTAGITASLGTHACRRSVVTSLFVEGGEALEDIARFVGTHQAFDHRWLRQASWPPSRDRRSPCRRAARRPGGR